MGYERGGLRSGTEPGGGSRPATGTAKTAGSTGEYFSRSGLQAYPHTATAGTDLATEKVKNKKHRIMANHKSSKKRIRQTAAKRAHNRLYHKTARNAVKALRNTSEKSAAEALLPKVTTMLDKLAKHNIVHKNKAANLKSALQLHVNAL